MGRLADLWLLCNGFDTAATFGTPSLPLGPSKAARSCRPGDTRRNRNNIAVFGKDDLLVYAEGATQPDNSVKDLCECSQASSTVISQFLPFVALTRFWGVCFRSQRPTVSPLERRVF